MTIREPQPKPKNGTVGCYISQCRTEKCRQLRRFIQAHIKVARRPGNFAVKFF